MHLYLLKMKKEKKPIVFMIFSRLGFIVSIAKTTEYSLVYKKVSTYFYLFFFYWLSSRYYRTIYLISAMTIPKVFGSPVMNDISQRKTSLIYMLLFRYEARNLDDAHEPRVSTHCSTTTIRRRTRFRVKVYENVPIENRKKN